MSKGMALGPVANDKETRAIPRRYPEVHEMHRLVTDLVLARRQEAEIEFSGR